MTFRHQNKTRRLPKKRHGKTISTDVLSKFLHANIQIPSIHASFHPGDDFYMAVNGHWVHHTSIPPHRTSYGICEEMEDGINKLLMNLVEDSKEDDPIGQVAASALHRNVQENNVYALKMTLRSISCSSKSPEDIARVLGFLSRLNCSTILSLSVEVQGEGCKKTYGIVVSPGSLGLPDSSYYIGSAPGKLRPLYAYTKLLLKVSNALDLDSYYEAIPIESAISAKLIQIRHQEIKEGLLNDEYLSISELERRFPKIPWIPLLEGYGLSFESRSIKLRVDSMHWMQHMETLFESLPPHSWNLLLSLHTILFALPTLPPPFDTWEFECFGRVLRGQKQKLPQTVLVLNTIKDCLPEELGRRFVKSYIPPSLKAVGTKFIQHIQDTAARRMMEVPWLKIETRKKAASKIRLIKLCIGYSEPIEEFSHPSLSADQFLGNICILESARTDRDLARIGRKQPAESWDEAPYIVNAYFYQDTNHLMIPAANLLWPMFSIDQVTHLGWNYGSLGALVGHEITHAFDKTGQEFDEHGVQQSWWTPQDRREYSKKTKTLQTLFSKQAIRGRHVNGESTLNENIADLGGLGIALDALHGTMQELKLSEAQQKKELYTFFCSYAVSWRTKERVQRHLQNLILDQHAPVELRVNLIVSQFDEWYEAFEVGPSHRLYIPPEDRIRIF